MSGYASRARVYRQEFAVRDDFLLLGRVLAGNGGLVIDAPAGAGRLLDVHAAHHRQVVLLDLEPAMVTRCRQQVVARGLSARVRAVEGDLRHWEPPYLASHIVIARGGLQVLASLEAMAEAVRRCAANLDQAGGLYIDVGLPWAQEASTQHDLPVFMRLAGATDLHGDSLIDMGNGMLVRRSYRSSLHHNQVVVDFAYELLGEPQPSWQDFEASTTWARLQPEVLREWVERCGLSVVATLGDYHGTPYAARSSRFICLATR